RAAAPAAAALRRARRLARRQLPHGRRHEHRAGRSRRGGRDLLLGLRDDARRRQQRPRHRPWRPARDPGDGRARVRLARARRAQRLHERGILYAPDFVVNAGGIIQLIGLEDEGWDETQLETALAGIGDTLRTLFAEAETDGITPAQAADRLARRRVAEARAA